MNTNTHPHYWNRLTSYVIYETPVLLDISMDLKKEKVKLRENE